MTELKLPKALTSEPNKIHPELKKVREEAGAFTEAEQKRVDDAKEREALKREDRRQRYKAKHGKGKPDPTMAKVNLTDGVRLGKKDAKKHETEWVVHGAHSWGRVAKQSEIQKSGVTAGWGDYSRAFEKARNPSPNGVHRDKPAQAKEKKVREIENMKSKGIYR